MRGDRIAAAVAGFALLVLLGAVVVREVALTVDPKLEWAVPVWGELTTSGTLWNAVAAAVLTMIAGALVFVAIRLLTPPAGAVVELGEDGASTRVDVAALQRLLTRQVERAVPGLKVARLWLDRESEGWRVWLLAELPWMEFEEARRRAAAAAADELRRAGDLRLRRLDLEVRRVTAPSGRKSLMDGPRRR
jgi:hypothetical protein